MFLLVVQLLGKASAYDSIELDQVYQSTWLSCETSTSIKTEHQKPNLYKRFSSVDKN